MGFVTWASTLVGRYFSSSTRVRFALSKTYLAGDGIEIGALHNPLPISRKARVSYLDRLSKDDLYISYPELLGKHIVEPDVIDDGEKLSQIEDGSLDFIIANHFIEHCEDPIGTIQNFYAKLRSGGVVYLAVPDKRYTFDRKRESTGVEHLERDYGDGGSGSRLAHYLDYARYALLNDGASEQQLEKLAREMMESRYSIHFHVWTFDEFFDFLRWLQERHIDGLEILEAKPNQREGIFVLGKQAAVSSSRMGG